MHTKFGGARSCDRNFRGQNGQRWTNLNDYNSVKTDIDEK